jgi:hypothetical protein
MVLGYHSPSWRPYTHKLELEVFTAAMLKKMKITRAEYLRMKTFPLRVRIVILKELKLDKESFS